MNAPTHLMGWVDDPGRHAMARTFAPPLAQAAPSLMGADQDAFLYRAYKDALGSYPGYVAQQIGDCFVAGTMVLGETTRPIEDVHVGDRVWTGQGRLTTVVSKRAIQTMKPMVEIRPVGGVPITCTADHRWMVYRFERANTKRITPNLYRRAVDGKVANSGAIVAQFEGRHPEWVPAGELRDTDCLLTPAVLDRLPMPLSPAGILTSPEGRFAFGYFLGNGSAGGGSVEWALPKGSESTPRLIAAMEALGFRPKFDEYKGREAERVRVHCRELVEWCEDVFYLDDNKSFPGWMIGDREFLEGLLAADGSRNGDTLDLCSTSLSIIYGAYASLVMRGIEPSICECSRSKGTYDNAKPLYRMNWVVERSRQKVWRDEHFVCRPVHSTRLIEGPATVYDIGVRDEHHSFLANGFAVHNCTSFGSAHAVDLLQCVEAVIGKEGIVYHETCSEAIYGQGREIAGMLGSGDGCYGTAVAKALVEYGAVPRSLVGEYSGRRAKQWGASGVPSDIKAEMAKHKVGAAALLTSLDELDAALANGYPAAGGFNQGFEMTRDADGVCRQSGRWGHEQCCAGRRRKNGKRQYLLLQSWGPGVPSGPLSDDQPDFSFWITEESMADIISQQDFLAFSKFPGFESRPLPPAWTYSNYI